MEAKDIALVKAMIASSGGGGHRGGIPIIDLTDIPLNLISRAEKRIDLKASLESEEQMERIRTTVLVNDCCIVDLNLLTNNESVLLVRQQSDHDRMIGTSTMESCFVTVELTSLEIYVALIVLDDAATSGDAVNVNLDDYGMNILYGIYESSPDDVNNGVIALFDAIENAYDAGETLGVTGTYIDGEDSITAKVTLTSIVKRLLEDNGVITYNYCATGILIDKLLVIEVNRINDEYFIQIASAALISGE